MNPFDYGLWFSPAAKLDSRALRYPSLSRFYHTPPLWHVYHRGVRLYYFKVEKFEDNKWHPRVWDSYSFEDTFDCTPTQEEAIAKGVEYIKEKVKALDNDPKYLA